MLLPCSTEVFSQQSSAKDTGPPPEYVDAKSMFLMAKSNSARIITPRKWVQHLLEKRHMVLYYLPFSVHFYFALYLYSDFPMYVKYARMPCAWEQSVLVTTSLTKFIWVNLFIWKQVYWDPDELPLARFWFSLPPSFSHCLSCYIADLAPQIFLPIAWWPCGSPTTQSGREKFLAENKW